MPEPVVEEGYLQKRAIEVMPTYQMRLAAIYKMTLAGNVPTPEAFVAAVQYANSLSAGVVEPEEVKNVETTVVPHPAPQKSSAS